MDKEQIILYAVLFVVIAGLSFSIFSLVKSKQGANDAKYNKYVSSENPDDICKTPEGYTDQEWREHMGHHPDRYKECLE